MLRGKQGQIPARNTLSEPCPRPVRIRSTCPRQREGQKSKQHKGFSPRHSDLAPLPPPIGVGATGKLSSDTPSGQVRGMVGARGKQTTFTTTRRVT